MAESKATAYKIIGISGSLRTSSTNTALIRLAAELAPKDRVAELEIVEFKDVPVYDGDIEAESGIPEKVKAIGEKIKAADGVYICTPEYNYSTSAALKNIIDWLSRLSPCPLNDKPAAIASVCAGPSGGLRAQYDVRKFLLFLKPHVMTLPEVSVAANYMKFDKETNQVTDEQVRKSVQKHIEAFCDHIAWVKRANGEAQ